LPDQVAGASRIPIDEFVVDDDDAKPAAVEPDLIDLTASRAAPHVPSRASRPSPVEEPVAPEEVAPDQIEELEPLPLDDTTATTPVAPAAGRRAPVGSTGNADDVLDLSASQENFSGATSASDTNGAAAVQPTDSESADAHDLPRRGWRTVQPEPVAGVGEPTESNEATEPQVPAEGAGEEGAGELDAAESAAAATGDDDSVLKFSQPTTTDAPDAFDLASASADVSEEAAPAEPSAKSEITAGDFATTPESAVRDAHPEPEPLPLTEDEAAEALGLKIDAGATAAPSALQPVARDEATIDSSTLRGQAASEPLAEEPVEPLLETSTESPPASKAPTSSQPFELELSELQRESMEPDASIAPVEPPSHVETDAPLLAPDALVDVPPVQEPPAEEVLAKKPRGRRAATGRGRGKKRAAEAVEEPQPIVPEPQEPAPAEAPGAAEILEQTEPTPESALNLDAASPEAPLDEAAIAEALGGTPSAEVDPLSDTALGREVRDLTGDAGEIIESRPAEVAEAPPAVETAPPQPVAEAPAPVAPVAPPPPAARRGPNYRFGANQTTSSAACR
jgi:hypothetical protein